MQAHLVLGSAPCCWTACPQRPRRLPLQPAVQQRSGQGLRNGATSTHLENHGMARQASSKGNSFVTYYFDPLNPENVVEVVAKPAQPTRSPPSNGYNGVAPAGSQLAKIDENKMLTQLQLATQQLEAAKTTIQKLRQYELMYKESKMRTKQMSAELATLQALLADKDAELARQYKRMEKEASERSGLRTQYTSALDEVRALRSDLEEARQAMLELRNALPANAARRTAGANSAAPKVSYVTSSNSTYATSMDSHLHLQQLDHDLGHGHSNGNGRSHSNQDVLHGLSGLAARLAEGMEHEVGSFFRK